jgi:hypothetical protein
MAEVVSILCKESDLEKEILQEISLYKMEIIHQGQLSAVVAVGIMVCVDLIFLGSDLV